VSIADFTVGFANALAIFTFSPPSLNFAFASVFNVFPAGHTERYKFEK
jgi:hypothetical protein